MSAFNQAIRLNLKYADAYANRGTTYARKGDYDHAMSDFDHAIRLNPRLGNLRLRSLCCWCDQFRRYDIESRT